MPRRKSAATLSREKKLKQRMRRMALQGEERQLWLARHAEYQRERRAQLSPEKLEQIRQTNAARNRRRRAALSPEGLERLRKANRERARRRRDTVRAGLLPDTAACPDFFTSVGLRRGRESPEATDQKHSSAGEESAQETGPVRGCWTSRGSLQSLKKCGPSRKSKAFVRRNYLQTGEQSADAQEEDPSVLLSSVVVELTEDRISSNVKKIRTVQTLSPELQSPAEETLTADEMSPIDSCTA